MTSVGLMGIPHDENSSYLRGCAEAPGPIRHELLSDVYTSWSETGVDLGAAGRLVDHGDIAFDGSATVAAKLLKEIGGMMVKNRIGA